MLEELSNRSVMVGTDITDGNNIMSELGFGVIMNTTYIPYYINKILFFLVKIYIRY